MVYKWLIIVIVLLMPICVFYEKNENVKYVGDEVINIFDTKEVEIPVLKTYEGYMTAYGPDCKGCSGITASGDNVLNTIYYMDNDFGEVRILAADKTIPFGTIIRITGLREYPDSVLAIVLDRGSAIGFKKKSYFDLLYPSERETDGFGLQYAKYEVLRFGY